VVELRVATGKTQKTAKAFCFSLRCPAREDEAAERLAAAACKAWNALHGRPSYCAMQRSSQPLQTFAAHCFANVIAKTVTGKTKKRPF